MDASVSWLVLLWNEPTSSCVCLMTHREASYVILFVNRLLWRHAAVWMWMVFCSRPQLRTILKWGYCRYLFLKTWKPAFLGAVPIVGIEEKAEIKSNVEVVSLSDISLAGSDCHSARRIQAKEQRCGNTWKTKRLKDFLGSLHTEESSVLVPARLPERLKTLVRTRSAL